MVARKPASKTTPAAKTTAPADAEKPTPVNRKQAEDVLDINSLLDTDSTEGTTETPSKSKFLRVLIPNFAALGRVWNVNDIIEVTPSGYESQTGTDGSNWIDGVGTEAFNSSYSSKPVEIVATVESPTARI